MPPNDVSPPFAVLQQRAKDFKFTLDADIDKCHNTFNSNISTLMHILYSPDVSSGRKNNSHVEFSRAKCLILANMKELYEAAEKEWKDYLNKMKAEFLEVMKCFLNNTKLVGNRPVLEVSSRFGGNSDSPYSVYDHGPGSSQYSTKQKSFVTKLKQSSTETSISMLSRLQDTSGHIETENIRPRNPADQLLNNTEQQMTFSQSFVEAPTNQGVSYSTTNVSNTTNQSLTQSINNQYETALPMNALNESAKTWNKNFINRQVTCSIPNSSNAIDQNLILENSLNANPASQIGSVIQSPKYKYSCLYCQKSFYHTSQLERHMPRHTKEKRFECRYCGKKLSHQGAKYNHEQLHCKKRFTDNLT